MFSRRKFLSLTSAAVLTGTSQISLAGIHKASRENRELKLLNLHTGERIQSHYLHNGGYQKDAIAELNHFFRDHRNNQITDMDPSLLDSIYHLTEQLDYRGEVHIISGYRSPETNEKLRQQGRSVAKRSFHLSGRAIDLRLPKVNLSQLHRAALQHHRGGVGYYSRSNFIHLDSGRVRQWGK